MKVGRAHSLFVDKTLAALDYEENRQMIDSPEGENGREESKNEQKPSANKRGKRSMDVLFVSEDLVSLGEHERHAGGTVAPLAQPVSLLRRVRDLRAVSYIVRCRATGWVFSSGYFVLVGNRAPCSSPLPSIKPPPFPRPSPARPVRLKFGNQAVGYVSTVNGLMSKQ